MRSLHTASIIREAFNLSGYGTIVVDATGIVRGVNLYGKELKHLIETIMEEEKFRPGLAL